MKVHWTIFACVVLIVSSGCQEWWCGEVALGNNFALVSDKPIQIIYCTSENACCDSGWPAVPGGVTEYGFDQRWIIAKRGDSEYWIIDKDFEIDMEGFDVPGRHEYYDSHIIGKLSESEFIHITDSLNIETIFRSTP